MIVQADSIGDRSIIDDIRRRMSSYGIKMAIGVKLLKALVWPIATYGCESWRVLDPVKSEETRLNAFELKCLRCVLRISWTVQTRKQMNGCFSLQAQKDTCLNP